jgi:two-component system sensor histidine kinase UhpB
VNSTATRRAHRLRPPTSGGLAWPRGAEVHRQSAAEHDRLRDYERLMGMAHLAGVAIALAAALVRIDSMVVAHIGWFVATLSVTACFAIVYHFVLPRWWCSHAKVVLGLVIDAMLVTALVMLTGYHMSLLVFLYYLIVVSGALTLETRALYGICAVITVCFAAMFPADRVLFQSPGTHLGRALLFIASVWLVGLVSAAAAGQIQAAERRLMRSLRSEHETAEQNARLSADLVTQLQASQALTASLQRQREQTQRLADMVIRAQEEERRRVSRELHDEANQTLAGLMTTVDAAEEAAQRGGAELAAVLERLRRLAAATLGDLQRIATELRPPALDEFGLVAALGRHVRERFAGAGMRVDFDIEGRRRRLPGAVEVALYRIAQEALTNVQKHAQARAVHVRLRFLPGVVRLDVSDDGVGFDDDRAPRLGLGLMGMRERASIVGGTVEVASRAGGGTRVSACIESDRSGAGGEPANAAAGPPVLAGRS